MLYGETSFFKVNAWRGRAEYLADSLAKGDRVMVTSRFRQRRWETPGKRSVTQVERTSQWGNEAAARGPA